MGNRPSVTPPVVLDTLQDSANALISTDKITTDEEGMNDKEKDKDLTDEDNKREEDDKEELERETAKPIGNLKVEKIVKGKGRKRKCAKKEIMEEVMTKAMKTVTVELKESEKMFVELEEKHMKFEERMKDKDREFQKEMMVMLVSHLPLPNPTQYRTNMYQPNYSLQPNYSS